MKVCRAAICFFFLALRDGNTGLINAKILVHTGTVGGNITVGCSFTFSGSRKIFCKKKCEGKDVLVKTTDNRAEEGRYSIEYKGSLLSYKLLNVSITHLTKSDSGSYRCALDRSWIKDSYQDFKIRVTDAPITLKPNGPLRPSSTRVPSASTPTTTQSLSSGSGCSSPSSASPEVTRQSPQQPTTPAAGPATGGLLYVGLVLVVMIIVLSAALLILCRKRASKTKEPPVETEYANKGPNRVYEEVREEDTRSRSPPVEMSTVYTYANYTKPNGVETTDDYSLATAAISQEKTEGDSSDLTYSQVDFSNGAAASLHAVPRGDADNVVYSVPRVEAASPPLYSTVALHQR